MIKKIAILYIATEKYSIFWKNFFESSEYFLLNNPKYEKHYFVFTNIDNINYKTNKSVQKIYQEALSWPYITLYRFDIFQKAREQLLNMDYIYFFNANMLCTKPIGEEILPTKKKPLVFVQHPGYFDKDRDAFNYERNPNSLAYISPDKGRYYFMGGLNGGTKAAYLSMIDTLDQQIKKDKSNNIIAIWHDESYLNRYAIDHVNDIKILSPGYGYPEGWDLPFDPKIIIRDKNKVGGHNYLRNMETFWQEVKRRLKLW